MYLLIDYREQDFIKKLSEFCIIENEIPKEIIVNNNSILIKITNLPIGDFIITDEINDNSKIKIAIERKSISDLYSSIMDGRFREQKSRLLNSIGDSLKICYLIEGTTNFKVQNKKTNVIRGSILNLMFKHNYRVIQTENKLDTFDNILLLYKKFKNNDFTNLESDNNNINSVKLIKRSENIKDSKLLYQLCLIPGISPKISNAIIDWLDKSVLTTNVGDDTSKSESCIKTNIKSIIDLYEKCNEEINVTQTLFGRVFNKYCLRNKYNVIKKRKKFDDNSSVMIYTKIQFKGNSNNVLFEKVRRWIKKNMKKPVVGFIAGAAAPKGKRMGHAGALISGEDDTAAAKFKILAECGITVANSPADLGLKLEEAMKSIKK